MILTLIQLVLTIFSAYVFLPVFPDFELNFALSFISPFTLGVSALVLSLVISLVRFIMACIFRKRISIIFNLILLVFDLILGFMFVL